MELEAELRESLSIDSVACVPGDRAIYRFPRMIRHRVGDGRIVSLSWKHEIPVWRIRWRWVFPDDLGFRPADGDLPAIASHNAAGAPSNRGL